MKIRTIADFGWIEALSVVYLQRVCASLWLFFRSSSENSRPISPRRSNFPKLFAKRERKGRISGLPLGHLHISRGTLKLGRHGIAPNIARAHV